MIDASLITPIIDMLKADITAIIPAGVTLMGLFLGVRMIPKIVKIFAK